MNEMICKCGHTDEQHYANFVTTGCRICNCQSYRIKKENKVNELCSVCGHPYDSHGSHSWCENKPCDCEEIPIVDELQRKLNDLKEVKQYARSLFADCNRLMSERGALQRKLNIAVEALEKIRQAKGGVVLVDDLGHKWEMTGYEGKIAQEALKKLEEQDGGT